MKYDEARSAILPWKKKGPGISYQFAPAELDNTTEKAAIDEDLSGRLEEIITRIFRRKGTLEGNQRISQPYREEFERRPSIR